MAKDYFEAWKEVVCENTGLKGREAIFEAHALNAIRDCEAAEAKVNELKELVEKYEKVAEMVQSPIQCSIHAEPGSPIHDLFVWANGVIDAVKELNSEEK
jgi:hypothetical protein